MKPKAFTLVELLVVMAIISFLSVGAFAGLSFGLRQARDVQKKKIVDLANTAMQAYYSDYAAYPKCTTPIKVATAGVQNWYYCNDAFPRPSVANSGFLISQSGSAGIKDYLEGEWPSSNSNADPGATSEYLRYYISAGAGVITSASVLKFAVCITVENKNSNNNLVSKGTPAGQKDCYCSGTEYSELSCAGMTGR